MAIMESDMTYLINLAQSNDLLIFNFILLPTGNRIEDFFFEKIDKKKPNRLTNLEYVGQDMIEAGNEFGSGIPYGESYKLLIFLMEFTKNFRNSHFLSYYYSLITAKLKVSISSMNYLVKVGPNTRCCGVQVIDFFSTHLKEHKVYQVIAMTIIFCI